MASVRTPGAGTAAGLRRAPVPELPDLHQIVLPTPWDVGPVQVYLVAAEPITLIDTGVKTPESRAVLTASLEALGLGLEDIERVVLTHYHADHLGQAESIRRVRKDLEVCAHVDEVSMIEGYSVERDERVDETCELFREYGVPEDLLQQRGETQREWVRTAPSPCESTRVDRPLRGGDRIPFKSFELEVVHAPGHSAGHLLLHEPRTRTLITGDHIMGNAVPFTDNFYLEGGPDPRDPLHRRPRFKGLSLYMDSVRALRRAAFRTILPAHGGVIRRPARALTDAQLFYEVRIQRIERGFRTLAAMGHEVTGWDIWKALFPNSDPITEMRNRMLMVIGALDVLEESGVCTAARREDGVLVHQHH